MNAPVRIAVDTSRLNAALERLDVALDPAKMRSTSTPDSNELVAPRAEA